MAQVSEITGHERCFACGKERSDGLRLLFEQVGGTVRSRFKPDLRFQSYDGIVHGGVLASIADATMANLVFRKFGGRPLTGNLNIRFRAPVASGDEILTEAHILRVKRDVVRTNCRITVGKRLCAEAHATFKVEQKIRA